MQFKVLIWIWLIGSIAWASISINVLKTHQPKESNLYYIIAFITIPAIPFFIPIIWHEIFFKIRMKRLHQQIEAEEKDFLENAITIPINFSDCTFEESPPMSEYYNPEGPQSSIVYYFNIDNKEYRFSSDYLPFDIKTLQEKCLQQKTTELLYHKDKPEEFHGFKTEFLYE